jgi:hypothetical protein
LNINIDIKEIGWDSMTGFVWLRMGTKRPYLVIMVMILPVLKIVGNFLTS